MVADTGSTNGTFVSGQRIPYGKAILVNNGEKLKFGTIDVVIEYMENNNDVNTVLEENVGKQHSSKNNLSEAPNSKQNEQKDTSDVGNNLAEANQK